MRVNQGNYILKRNDLWYPELCYRINGVLFEVFKEIGGGHKEEYFQKAVAVGLQEEGLNYIEQYFVPLKFRNKTVGKYFLDFLIEDKIVLELKRGKYIPAKIIDQATNYLETLNLPLALVACFTQEGVSIKRIVNHNYIPK